MVARHPSTLARLTFAIVTLVAGAARASAQTLSPKNGSLTAAANVANKDTALFALYNNTPNSTAFSLGPCNISGTVTACSYPSSFFVPSGQTFNVPVTFSAGAPGTGTITLTVSGGVDWGSYNVTTVPKAVSVTPHGGTAPWRMANTGGYNQTFTVKNTGTVQTAYTLTCGPNSSNVTCSRISLTSMTLAAGDTVTDTAYYSVRAPGSGTLSLSASGGITGVSDVGVYNVPVDTLKNPTVTLAYSANLSHAADGVSYVHPTPAVGSMATTRALSLVYNSAAARPVALVALDATAPTPQPAPTVYELQVQLASNGVNLTLMNGTTATAVYYAGTAGVNRLTAAIDARANGLATGSYPVNLVLTTTYPAGTKAMTVPSRILVNDQTASPFGAGVGVSGVGHLYTIGSYGRLLVDGSGAMEYFDRTCSGCSFVSPAGESGTLVSYTDTLFRLTALDGSFADFNTQGFLVRHNVLASIQDLTFAWTNSLLTAVTDASGRGFTLSYAGGLLTQITDFASRTTSTSIANGLLVKVTDPDGRIDSLTYNGNNLLTQLNSRTGGVWHYGYNVLQQGDTVRAPSATDYAGTNVPPTATVVTAAEVQWQASIAGTLAGAPKGSVLPDTIYGVTTDPLGRVSKTQLDRFGQATTIVDALGEVTTITRDTLGNAISVLEPTGHITSATYVGYLLTASSDNATGQSLSYMYGRTTANQGLSAHYGWNDPDGLADGVNTIGFPRANQDTTLLPATLRLYNILGDPSAGTNLPAVDSNYTVQFLLTASTPTVTPGNNSTITAYVTTEYSTNSGTSWTSVGGTSQVSASLSTPGVATAAQVFTPTVHFSGGGPVWIRLILRGTSSGALSGGWVKVQVYASTGWTTDPYAVRWSNASGNTPTRLVAVRGSSTWLDYFYHDGTQGPAGALKEVYAGNTAAPGSGPTGGAVVAWHYPNAYGQDTLLIDGGGHTSRWVYAAPGSGGNLVQTIDASGHVTVFHYNTYGLVDTTTLANGVKQWVAYDAINRTTAATNGLGQTTQYSYDSVGLRRVTDAKGQVYKFDPNAWGVVVARHDLGDTTKVDSLKYDAAGELRTVITRRADTLSLTYDPLGRLLTRTGTGPDSFPAESLSYGLTRFSGGNPSGSWIVASSTNGRDSLAYDQAGRLSYAAQHFPGDTTYAMTYTYNATGTLTNRTAPPHGSPARWVYRPALGVLDTLCAVGTCTAVARDTEMKPVTVTYNAGAANPWSDSLFYDSLHHVTGDAFSAAAPQASLTSAWTYDSLGRVEVGLSQRGVAYPREVYTYDGAGDLINACQMQSSSSSCNNEYHQPTVSAYLYDAAGNRVDTTAHAVIAPGNRVTQFQGYAITYDANGDVIQKAGLGTVGWGTSTDTTTLRWNAIGQLTRVEKWPAGGAHTIVTFRYDAMGRRIGKRVGSVTTWFIYDRDHLEMDLDSATHAMRAEYGFTPTGALYALRTPTDTAVAVTTPTIGTVLGLARANGAAVLKAFPDRVGNSPLLPWGQEPADTGFILRYRMAQQEYDQEIALYHMGARYYDPMLGRWLSEDPLGISGGTNLYSYAGNDPVNGRDPRGMGDCQIGGYVNGVPTGVRCHYNQDDCMASEHSTDQCYDRFDEWCARMNGGVTGDPSTEYGCDVDVTYTLDLVTVTADASNNTGGNTDPGVLQGGVDFTNLLLDAGTQFKVDWKHPPGTMDCTTWVCAFLNRNGHHMTYEPTSTIPKSLCYQRVDAANARPWDVMVVYPTQSHAVVFTGSVVRGQFQAVGFGPSMNTDNPLKVTYWGPGNVTFYHPVC